MIPALLTKPLGSIVAADVSELVDREWPESEQVEYKSSIGKGPGQEAFLQGQRLSGDAKKEIFEEVISFANALGGHLVLGVDENRVDGTNRASALTPIPRCADLAEAIEATMRDAVQPPLLTAQVVAVKGEGDAGYVVVRVQPSAFAPHAYATGGTLLVTRRIGSSAQRLPMRAVQELTLKKYFEEQQIDSLFAQRQVAFRNWIKERSETRSGDGIVSGARATAIPRSLPETNQRVLDAMPQIAAHRDVILVLPKRELRIGSIFGGGSQRAIVRGARLADDDVKNDRGWSRVDLHDNGLVDNWIGIQGKAQGGAEHEAALYWEWLFSLAANCYLQAQALREFLKAPGLEYSVELELFNMFGSSSAARGRLVHGQELVRFARFYEFDALPVVFPRYVIREQTTLAEYLHQADRDIADLAGLKDWSLDYQVRPA